MPRSQCYQYNAVCMYFVVLYIPVHEIRRRRQLMTEMEMIKQRHTLTQHILFFLDPACATALGSQSS